MAEATLQEVFVKLEKIEGELENIRFQEGIFLSRFDSERGTVERRHKEFKEGLDNLHDLIYNRDTGIAFELDRLKQKEQKRNIVKAQMIGLYIAVGLLIFAKIIDFIIKLK